MSDDRRDPAQPDGQPQAPSPFDNPTESLAVGGDTDVPGSGSHTDAPSRPPEPAAPDSSAQVPNLRGRRNDFGSNVSGTEAEPTPHRPTPDLSKPDLAHGPDADSTLPTERIAEDRDQFYERHARRRGRAGRAAETAVTDAAAWTPEASSDGGKPDEGGKSDDVSDPPTVAYSLPDADTEAFTPTPPARASRGRTDDGFATDSGHGGDGELERYKRASRRGTLDLGLLILRVAVGLIAMAHGSQKLFGWWNGPKLGDFTDYLINNQNTAIGFAHDAARPLAIVGALSETLGGLMLVIGLLTPIAGSAVLGVMIIATAYKATLAGGVWFFASDPAGRGGGVEYEIFLGVAAAAIILTGPGRLALDFNRGWARRPFLGSLAWLVIGVAAAVAVWLLFNGTNPIHSPGNSRN